MTAIDVGKQLVALCREGKFEEAMNSLYADKIVSIEAQDMEQMPARIEGIEAVRKKSEWWEANHDVHRIEVRGPFCGYKPDQFAVDFEIETTFKPTGERSTMKEVALYTVAEGKVVQEEFLYQID